MIFFANLVSWWNALVHRTRVDNDIETELQFHIDAHTQRLIDLGVPPREAKRRSKIEFGRVDVQKEKYRSAIGLGPLHEIGGDVRYGLRSLYRNKAVSLVAVLSLALGIGATTAMFSLIYATLLHPFPYADADRIVNPAVIDEKHPQVPTWFALTPRQFESFRHARSIDTILGFNLAGLEATGSDLPENVSAAYVTSNASSFFGIPAMLGRGIQASDVPARSNPLNIVVLGYDFWKRKYPDDKSILGKTLQLNHEDYTIVGVMPQRFTFTQTVGGADVYIPWTPARFTHLFPWIKLKPGVSVTTADAEFQSYLVQFKKETPKHFPDSFHVNVQPILQPYVHNIGRTLTLLFASVVLLLIIGCANCSVLLLARGESRHHELAIRSAIGASRFRIVRQLLVESMALALSGACIGVIISYWLANLPLKLLPNDFPHEAVISINLPVLCFSVGLALLTGLLFGLAPALRLSRPDVSRFMQSGARSAGVNSSKGALNTLVAGQIALTLILLCTAGAAIAGFIKITRLQLGYDPHNVMAVGIPLKRDTKKNHPERAAYINQLRESVAAIPNVLDVAVALNSIPPNHPFSSTQVPFDVFGSQPEQEQQAGIFLVSPEYFATLKIPLLNGRLWDQTENQRGDFVAVINQTLAQRYWPKGDAVGHQLRATSLKDDGSPLAAASPQSGEWRQIIGVVADSRNDGLDHAPEPAIFVPYTTFMWDEIHLLIRTTSSPLASFHAVRVALQSVNPDQRAFNHADDLEETLQYQPLWSQQRLFSILFAFFACLALALSLVGLSSTVVFAVSRRMSELGIRMALGAQRWNIVWLVMRTTSITVLSGIAVGLLLNLALQRLLRHWTPASIQTPLILAGITLLLIASAVVACLPPLKRAANVDPAQTLRSG
jgi:predicted permease